MILFKRGVPIIKSNPEGKFRITCIFLDCQNTTFAVCWQPASKFDIDILLSCLADIFEAVLSSMIPASLWIYSTLCVSWLFLTSVTQKLRREVIFYGTLHCCDITRLSKTALLCHRFYMNMNPYALSWSWKYNI